MAKIKYFQISNSLTQGLEETMSVAQNYQGQLRIEVLQLNKLEVDPDNPRDLALDFSDVLDGIKKNDPLYERKQKELENLRSLAESIKKEGVINPIIVIKYGEKYRIVAGERRALASVIAEKHDIQARILDKKPSDLRLSFLQWIENVERENLSLWERLKNLEKIINASKQEKNSSQEITPTILSKMLGCALSHAVNYCHVLNSDASIKNEIKENRIRNLEKAALIAQVKNPEIRMKAIESCIAGVSLKNLKDVITAAKEAYDKLKSKRIIESGKRGRQALQVNLGVTKKITAVKFIIESILQNPKYDFLKATITSLNWKDFGDVTKAFQNILKTIEDNE